MRNLNPKNLINSPKKLLPPRDVFSSKFGILAAAAGSAIGLGNVWKFPYITGVYGGGAFFLVYLFFILLIGIPVMLSEFTIGRTAKRNAYGAFKRLAPRSPWYMVGLMGVVSAFVILSFYSAVAGWTLEYIFHSVFNDLSGKSPEQLELVFDQFTSSVYRPIFWQLLFMVVTATIVMAGIKKGIEKYAKILMPLLLVLIIVLDIRAITLPGAMKGLSFLFNPDFSKLTSEGILSALGHAFFSLSLGMGTLITYGSYINDDDHLGNTALEVSIADTIIAVLAGIAIFPAVFAFGIEPSSGPGLIFITLPNIFQQIPGGQIFSIIFFILLAIAALTSSISVMEVVVAYFSEELNLKRKNATILAAISISFVGVLCSLSLRFPDLKLFNLNIFDFLDFTASNILLPLGGLFIAVFTGWVYGKKRMKMRVTNEDRIKAPYFSFYIFFIKFLAPIGITIVFLHGLGILDFIF